MDPIQQLPWHEDAVWAFEAFPHEVSHPSTQAKRDQPSIWMGKYLKPGKLSQTRSTYFKPEGASSIIFPARVNARYLRGGTRDTCTLSSTRWHSQNSHKLKNSRLLNLSLVQVLFVAPPLLQVLSLKPGLLRPLPLSSPRLPLSPQNNKELKRFRSLLGHHPSNCIFPSLSLS